MVRTAFLAIAHHQPYLAAVTRAVIRKKKIKANKGGNLIFSAKEALIFCRDTDSYATGTCSFLGVNPSHIARVAR